MINDTDLKSKMKKGRYMCPFEASQNFSSTSKIKNRKNLQ